MSQFCCVCHIFDVCKWFGIGVGDARTLFLKAEGDNLFRKKFVISHFIRSSLRNVMVLAIEASEVAPCTCNRKTLGARMKMV
jgi:hypothetical protein